MLFCVLQSTFCGINQKETGLKKNIVEILLNEEDKEKGGGFRNKMIFLDALPFKCRCQCSVLTKVDSLGRFDYAELLPRKDVTEKF